MFLLPIYKSTHCPMHRLPYIDLAKKAINVTNLTTKPGQALITAPNINTQHVLAWLQRPGPSNK